MLCVIPSCFTYELLLNEYLRMKVGSTNYDDQVNFFQNLDFHSIIRTEIFPENKMMVILLAFNPWYGQNNNSELL
jgi:hypothetical protein